MLHTNFNPLNVLLTAHGAWLIDWAWPTRGAAFIDPACFLLRLMLGGHTASQAEAWAAQCTSWGKTPDHAINVFGTACARLYDEIAREDPQPLEEALRCGSAGLGGVPLGKAQRGAVIITVSPAFAARPGSPQPLILSRRGSAVVTAVFLALLCWLVIETQGGSDLGMAERLTSSVQTSWLFVVAVVLWRRAARRRWPELPGEPPEASHAQAMTTGAMMTGRMTTGALRGGRDLA